MESPVPQAGPGRRWHTREDSGLRLDAEGRLWHDDEPIENARVALAFRQGLERDEQGRYLIRFGWDWAVLRVEDAPYQALGARVEGGRLALQLDDGREVVIGGERLSASAEGVLYASVPGKGGALEARFSRAAQGQLAELLDERDGQLVLRLDGQAHPSGERPPRAQGRGGSSGG
jgi:uncharacterized protein